MKDVDLQGSCLVPLFFLFPISDLPCTARSSATSLFADDVILLLRSYNLKDLNEAIDNCLRDMDSWLRGNKLSSNVTKTQNGYMYEK